MNKSLQKSTENTSLVLLETLDTNTNTNRPIRVNKSKWSFNKQRGKNNKVTISGLGLNSKVDEKGNKDNTLANG